MCGCTPKQRASQTEGAFLKKKGAFHKGTKSRKLKEREWTENCSGVWRALLKSAAQQRTGKLGKGGPPIRRAALEHVNGWLTKKVLRSQNMQ